jgi:ankyrin repeat protein
MNVIKKIILGSPVVLLLSCDEGGRLGGGGPSAGGFTTNRLLIQMDFEEMFDDEGVRSLAEAAGRGNIRRIDELVASGVNVNYVGGGGATPLLWGFKNYRGFNRLLELGANPNAVYQDGSTLMYWAVMHEDIRFLQAALAHGGDPNLRDRSYFQYTPLFTALSKGQSKIDLLLKAGAEINAKDAFGGTPMMVAAGRGDFDVVAHLLSRGADPKLKDRAGDSLKSRINKLEGALIADSEREKWRQIVIQDLKRRGIM